MEVKQRLNKAAFAEALKARRQTQAMLAEKIGANEKTFSRWINEESIPSKYIWDITEELDLTDDELDEILKLPKYKVFFRKKFLGEVPEEIQTRAIELAQTLFDLTYFNSSAKFLPPNCSRIDDPIAVADQIRRYTKIDTFNNLQGIVSILSELGVETAVLPFKKFGVVSDKEHEKAFSVSNGNRCFIYLDSDLAEEGLMFNLCHELAHLFRPEYSEFSNMEEKFCNAVAEELIYPKVFFETHRIQIQRIVDSNSVESVILLMRSIRDTLGGELYGISIQLKKHGFLSKKNPLTKKVTGYGYNTFHKLQKLDEIYFTSYDHNNLVALKAFWNQEVINKNILLRFFYHIKNSATAETLSSRKFAELFRIDLGFADELIHKWRHELREHLKESENG